MALLSSSVRNTSVSIFRKIFSSFPSAWRTAVIRASQFRIFVWKGCIVPLAVEHYRYPFSCLAKLCPSPNRTNHSREGLLAD